MLEEINDKNKNDVSGSDKNKLLFITKKKKKRRRSTKTKNEQAKNLDLKINSDINSNKDNGVVKPKKNKKKRKKKAASKNDNPKNNIEIFESQSNKLNINKKVKNIMEYNDDEKNLFSYDLAIEYDHRTFCEYYISLLRTKHYLFSAFFYDKDYNSRIIKINLFFKRFIISYAINALFFNDDTLHEIYENKGSYDFIYELPKIIYSSLIPMVLITVLNKLGLTNEDIIDLKNEKSKNNIDEMHRDFGIKLRIKFLLYFIISSILIVFFWYYLSMFCAIYSNDQLHLFKDILTSFGLSLIYPFFIHLLPGMFRIPSLAKPKMKRVYLYNLSKVIQMV